ANSASEALEILEHQPVDLILSDIIMPDMNGYQLAAVIREKYPEIKVQLASGYSDIKNVDMVDNDLQNNILLKPFNIQKLLRRIRTLLDGKDIA
ncbi:MAG TPA: response regulator, partial [Gammaproteobacteria bacterium]|nr:response regulator [Gammaproteobacteria bacterium]